MIPSVQVTFRNLTELPDVRKLVETRVQKLETFCKPILSCRVVVEVPAKHHRKGFPFQVHIEAMLTDGRINVKHAAASSKGHRDIGSKVLRKGSETTSERHSLQLTIRDAFDSAKRQLQDHARRRRAEVKTHEPTLEATVSRILPDQGYGYLETSDGREIYFHENSVIGGQFDKLKLGTKTHFAEEEGQKGPQASTVRITKKSRAATAVPGLRAASKR